MTMLHQRFAAWLRARMAAGHLPWSDDADAARRLLLGDCIGVRAAWAGGRLLFGRDATGLALEDQRAVIAAPALHAFLAADGFVHGERWTGTVGEVNAAIRRLAKRHVVEPWCWSVQADSSAARVFFGLRCPPGYLVRLAGSADGVAPAPLTINAPRQRCAAVKA